MLYPALVLGLACKRLFLAKVHQHYFVFVQTNWTGTVSLVNYVDTFMFAFFSNWIVHLKLQSVIGRLGFGFRHHSCASIVFLLLFNQSSEFSHFPVSLATLIADEFAHVLGLFTFSNKYGPFAGSLVYRLILLRDFIL